MKDGRRCVTETFCRAGVTAKAGSHRKGGAVFSEARPDDIGRRRGNGQQTVLIGWVGNTKI